MSINKDYSKGLPLPNHLINDDENSLLEGLEQWVRNKNNRMEFNVPKQFDLISRTYKVIQLPKVIYNGESVLGQCKSDLGIIEIRKNLNKELKRHTFLHESTHAILESLGYTELSLDEKFVDAFSNALYQVLKTSK